MAEIKKLNEKCNIRKMTMILKEVNAKLEQTTSGLQKILILEEIMKNWIV